MPLSRNLPGRATCEREVSRDSSGKADGVPKQLPAPYPSILSETEVFATDRHFVDLRPPYEQSRGRSRRLGGEHWQSGNYPPDVLVRLYRGIKLDKARVYEGFQTTFYGGEMNTHDATKLPLVCGSLFVGDDLRRLKISTLISDKVIVPDYSSCLLAPVGSARFKDASEAVGKKSTMTGRTVLGWDCLPDKVRRATLPLQRKGFVKVRKIRKMQDAFRMYGEFDTIKNDLSKVNCDYTVPIIDELVDVAEKKSQCVRYISPSDTYYGLKGQVEMVFEVLAGTWFTEASSSGVPLLTDSEVVNRMLANFLTKDSLVNRYPLYPLPRHHTSVLAKKVLEEFVPDIGDAYFPDILEVKEKFSDELAFFRSGLTRLSAKLKELPWSRDLEEELGKLVETEVRPSLFELKRSLKTSTRKVVEKVFANIKDPKSYLPFGATILTDVAPMIATLASVGIAGFKTLYDLYVERKTIEEKNNLIFLVKARGRLAYSPHIT
jgi:hypothetical protein